LSGANGRVIILGSDDLAALSREAASRPRLRFNRNIHQMSDSVHRLLNAVEPGTYIRPHRHLTPPKDETIVVLSGAVGILVFDDAGNVIEKAILAPHGRMVADLPAGIWHTLISLTSGTVFFETKKGPYVPPRLQDLAAWAPAEEDQDVRARESVFRAFFGPLYSDFTRPGDRPPGGF